MISTCLTEDAPCLDFKDLVDVKLHWRIFFLIRKAQKEQGWVLH